MTFEDLVNYLTEVLGVHRVLLPSTPRILFWDWADLLPGRGAEEPLLFSGILASSSFSSLMFHRMLEAITLSVHQVDCVGVETDLVTDLREGEKGYGYWTWEEVGDPSRFLAWVIFDPELGRMIQSRAHPSQEVHITYGPRILENEPHLKKHTWEVLKKLKDRGY